MVDPLEVLLGAILPAAMRLGELSAMIAERDELYDKKGTAYD
jgi:hypothetical protein